MWELDYKESWALKNWCFWTVVLEKTLESPLDFKEIQPVHPKGDQSWRFIGRTDAEAETLILWLPDVKNWLLGKDPDAGKYWKQKEKGTTEDEMVAWHYWLDGHEFEQAPGVGEGQGGLACCSLWFCRVIHDWATELNLTSMGSLSLLLSNHPHLLPPDGRPSAYPECTIQGWWVSRNQILASVLFWPCTNHPNTIFWAHLQRGKSKNWNSTNVTLLHSYLLGSGKVKGYLSK